MALSAFTPGSTVELLATPVSSNVALPVSGSPPTAVVTNVGEWTAFVSLGTSNAVTAAFATSMAIRPGATVALTLGSNTYLAAVALGNGTALNITTGT